MLVAGHDDKIILEDRESNLVYMLRSTGVVVVGRRTFPGVSVHEPPPSLPVVPIHERPPSQLGCSKVVGCLVAILVVVGLGVGLFQYIAYSAAKHYATSDLKALAPGSRLAGYWDSQGNEHVDYIAANGHVHELYYAGKQWISNDLTVLSKGAIAILGSALDGYAGSNNSQHVDFISANHHTQELSFNLKTHNWVDNDLTALSKGTTAVAGSILVGYMGNSGSEHINYIGANYHVYELFYSRSSWADNDLTMLSGGSKATTASALDGYIGSDGSIHVNFIGSNQDIHELYFASGWVDNDLTALSKGTKAVHSSLLDGYWGSDGSVHVNYIGANYHVYELYFSPATHHWVDQDLTVKSKGVPAAVGSALVGSLGTDGVEHVNYIGNNQHIHELYYSGSNWSDADLTAKTNGTLAAAGSPVDSYLGNDGSEHINYIGTDQHIHEIFT